MKWIAISGSWRTVNESVESDVRAAVSEIIQRRDGIVTGGALGVDYIATDEVLKNDPCARHILIITPVPLVKFLAHYRNRAKEGVVTDEQVEKISKQLQNIFEINPSAIIEMDQDSCNPKTYYRRNTEIIRRSHSLLAFRVNGSEGTGDAIKKAQEIGIPVFVEEYTI